LGEVYSKAGQSAKAQNYFDSAMALCKELQAYVYEPQILRNMASNYYKQGKMKEAYYMMINYDKAKEKIYGEESSRKIAQMEIALDLQAREKEVDALKIEGKVKSLELHNTRMVITIIVLSVLIALSLFNLFWHRKKG
jgi:tetratricopeptide (TPR) repeat protein